MHVQHCDVTHDVMALMDDVTSKNKMTHFRRSASEVCYHEIAWKWLQNLGQGPPRLLGDPRDATPSPAYLGMSP